MENTGSKHGPKPKIHQDLKALLPPLATEEREALEADIKRHGVRQPIAIDEQGNILDGMTRFSIDPACPFVVEHGLTWPEKKAFTIRANFVRRNLTPDQKRGVRDDMKKTAALLLADGKTQQDVAALLGVSQQTVAYWGINNTNVGNAYIPKPDARIKLNDAAKLEAVDRVKAGESQEQVAADFGVTQARISQEVARVKKKEDRSQQLAAQSRKATNNAAKPGSPPWRILHGDCLDLLSELAGHTQEQWAAECQAPSLIIADPPYNIGLDYGAGTNDAKTVSDYLKWSERWLSLCYDCAAGGAAMWIVINDEHAHHIRGIAESVGFAFRNWVIWYESFGVQCVGKFARCHRHLLHFSAGDGHVFNAEAAKVPSDRQVKYNDNRAAAGGKVMPDVWLDIPRLTGNNRERIEGTTQLPLKLLERIVSITCQPGGTVLDPFSGSGTAGVVATTSGRPFIGFEINEDRRQLALGRIRESLE